MDKKYELILENTIEYEGRTLYQIRALKDFGPWKAGNIGGHIESEDNLSQEGSSWVVYGSVVLESAHVCGSSTIGLDSVVRGRARLTDTHLIHSVVTDHAEVIGCRVHDSTLVQSAKCSTCKIERSRITDASYVSNCEVSDSFIAGNDCIVSETKVSGSLITDSIVGESTITDSTIRKSGLMNVVIDHYGLIDQTLKGCSLIGNTYK